MSDTRAMTYATPETLADLSWSPERLSLLADMLEADDPFADALLDDMAGIDLAALQAIIHERHAYAIEADE